MTSWYRGALDPNDLEHKPVSDPSETAAPFTIKMTDILYKPQYAPSISGPNHGYDPAGDCGGLFMPYKMQPHNNCYNYACDNATNTYAVPGQAHGYQLQLVCQGAEVVKAAQQDGLLLIGDPGPNISDLQVPAGLTGWFAALLIAPIDAHFTNGGFHWVRCDSRTTFDSWSQKDGTRNVTNYDFAGNLIADPRKANWRTNDGAQGPVPTVGSDTITTYDFYAFMFVPDSGVTIS